MAHNMTSSDEGSDWNSMSKPHDESIPIVTNSDNLALDSKDQEIEPPDLPVHVASASQDMESSAVSNAPDIQPSTESQEQTAPTAATSNTPPNSGLNTAADATPEPSAPHAHAVSVEQGMEPSVESSAPEIHAAAESQEQTAPAEAPSNSTGNAAETSTAGATLATPIDNNVPKLDGHNNGASDSLSARESVGEAQLDDLPSHPETTKTSSSPPPERSAVSSTEGDKFEPPIPASDSHVWKGDYGGDKDGAATNGDSDTRDHEFWGKESGDGEEDFFNQLNSQTKPIYETPETESRFDEGVPLLDENNGTPAKPTTKTASQIDQIFKDDEDEAAGFFSEVQKSATQEPPHLNRKSTSEVIASVGGAQDSPINETLPASQQFDSHLADPTSHKEVKKASSEEDLAARWQAALDDDDDDLLLEDEIGDDSTADQYAVAQDINVPVNNAAGLDRPFETPTTSARPPPPLTSFVPHQPSTSELLQGVTAPSYFTRPTRPNLAATRAESFAERSKEGYKSPYDIPMDLTRPRRPVASQKPVVVQPGNAPAAPPRSSSIPPPTAASMQTGAPPPAASVPPPKNFYEELPPPPQRPRPASSGRYTPDSNAPAAGFSSRPPPPPPTNPYTNIPPVPESSAQSYGAPQLQQPERLDPYANTLAPNPPAMPSTASRYSPKPPGSQAGPKPSPSPRYSPAPPPSSAPPRNRYASQPPVAPTQGAAHPFQPRTSSPLAYHEKISHQHEEHPPVQPAASASPPNVLQPRHSIDHSSQAPLAFGDAADTTKGAIHENAPSLMNEQQTSSPRNPYAPPAYVNEFSQRLAPVASGAPAFSAITSRDVPQAGNQQFAPPRRSQTQSPSRQQHAGPSLPMQSVDTFQRPASAHDSSSPIKEVSPYAPSQVSARNRAASQHLQFVPPNDGQQLDPLERWKGAPIVSFGFGGVVTSCFPRHIPRYVAGQAAPMIKSTPGEVKVSQLKDWIPATESIVQHPGPLKTKSKKKDLLAWLSSKVAAFENEGLSEISQVDPDSHKRHDEKILLWKIVRVMVEHDGALDGSDSLQASLRNVIFPNLQNQEFAQTYGGGFTGASSFQPSDVPSQPDAVNAQLVDSLRNDLVIGDRQKAVWAAVDSRLWGHAMVIASTLDKSVWKQVVQEFVRREVRSTTGNTESLAALYEIFAGNIEESIDELVPPSARAGLQMISKVNGSGPTKNALDGLDRWRDTLGLVLSNRSPDDYHALLALGKLLSSYGRIEAAHICYIFSRVAVFSGSDDPQANIVLLGADHQRFPSSFYQDEDAILLTEVYEYAISVLAGASTATLPHLLAFKLLYAQSLADNGRKSEALQYCDLIAAALRASTRPSAYHHQHLFSEVGDLSARLRQTTSDGGSWISRPSMEKVSGSMWARFNSFVSGEDSDAASTGSGKAGDADIGPFAKISGTPTVSRSPSVSDFYGSYPGSGSGGQPIPPNGPSRYHPASQYAPNSSPEQLRGRSSFDSQRSGFGFGQRRNSQEISTPDHGMYHGGSLYNSPSAAGYQSTPPQSSYMPLAPVEEDMTYQGQSEGPYASMQPPPVDGVPYQHPISAPDQFGGPLYNQNPTAMPPSDSVGYMPPTSTGGYEPPGSDALGISTPGSKEDAAEEGSQTNKPFMEDDDSDIAARAANLQKAEKERKDREADEAFRKAAEEDAKKPPPPKKSWFGGWFGGGKKNDDNLGGPIRAKLGEENSFYYDTELKKWVNKKDPKSATPVRATPPPPKASAPPTRTGSATSMPPPVPSPMPMNTDNRPSTSGGAPTAPSSDSLGVPRPIDTMGRSASSGAVPKPPSAAGPPPPRPALSNANSIDDLLGAPQARKGNTVRGKKKGRGYVDVMAK
ncbi:hypothetical protein PHISCL_01573 [Aspergillus sclerotialis]|uniref:Protein transport protein sec16 n=1 Tax=Aspergillus sclerotialis TaxID=2070753 RepID=A0A3A2ZTT9_9EURO|nr:hypothetical protein PHISCL_01573 [Aspergillus sclerotialis]